MSEHPACSFCGRRFHPQGFSRHEQACGRGSSQRFRIIAVTGWSINPSAIRQQHAVRPPGTSYTICDSHRQWEEVAHFWVKESLSSVLRRERAEALCRRWNAEEYEAELSAA